MNIFEDKYTKISITFYATSNLYELRNLSLVTFIGHTWYSADATFKINVAEELILIQQLKSTNIFDYKYDGLGNTIFKLNECGYLRFL